MAKQKGIIKIQGSVGGLTFYDRDGETVVKTTTGLSKDRIERDPALKRTRENMAEFGGSAKVGKALRHGFASVIRTMSDNSVVGRLTGIMKKINAAGPGERGKRAFEIVNQQKVLEGFEFNRSKTFGSVFYAPNEGVSMNVDRNIANWFIPDFNTDEFIRKPEGAKHFKLLLVTTVLSDYTYSEKEKTYEAVNPVENNLNGMAFSSAIPLSGVVGSDITLTVDLEADSPMPATVGVINAVGIVFYQETNSELYELASDNAMRIELIG